MNHMRLLSTASQEYDGTGVVQVRCGFGENGVPRYMVLVYGAVWRGVDGPMEAWEHACELPPFLKHRVRWLQGVLQCGVVLRCSVVCYGEVQCGVLWCGVRGQHPLMELRLWGVMEVGAGQTRHRYTLHH